MKLKAICISLLGVFALSAGAWSTHAGNSGGNGAWTDGTGVEASATLDKFAYLRASQEEALFDLNDDYDIDEATLNSTSRMLTELDTRSNSNEGFQIRIGEGTNFSLSNGVMGIDFTLGSGEGNGSGNPSISAYDNLAAADDVLYEISNATLATDNSRSDIPIKINLQETPGLLANDELFQGSVQLTISAN